MAAPTPDRRGFGGRYWKDPAWQWALRQPVRGGERLALLMLAVYANADQGWCAWPAISTLAKLTNLYPSSVRRAIRRLERRGLIRTEQGGGSGLPNRYYLQLQVGESTPDDTPKPSDVNARVMHSIPGNVNPGAAHVNGRVSPTQTLAPTPPEGKEKEIEEAERASDERAQDGALTAGGTDLATDSAADIQARIRQLQIALDLKFVSDGQLSKWKEELGCAKAELAALDRADVAQKKGETDG